MFPGGREFGGLNKTEFLKEISYFYLYFSVRHVEQCLPSVQVSSGT